MGIRRRKPAAVIPLTKADRCDRCGAEGHVRLVKDGLDLVFCAHHYRTHDIALSFAGFLINDDTRDTLTTRPADVRGA
jgi:hypothetical protein